MPATVSFMGIIKAIKKEDRSLRIYQVTTNGGDDYSELELEAFKGSNIETASIGDVVMVQGSLGLIEGNVSVKANVLSVLKGGTVAIRPPCVTAIGDAEGKHSVSVSQYLKAQKHIFRLELEVSSLSEKVLSHVVVGKPVLINGFLYGTTVKVEELCFLPGQTAEFLPIVGETSQGDIGGSATKPSFNFDKKGKGKL